MRHNTNERLVALALAAIFACSAVPAFAADGVSLIGTRIFAAEEQTGVPSYALGMPLSAAWAANPTTDQIVRYEWHMDALAPVSAGLALAVTIPQAQLTLGTHDFFLKACNTTGCSPEASYRFAVVLALPSAPTGLRVAPVGTVVAINRKQGEDYVFGYCMWAIDRSCTRSETGAIEQRLGVLFPGVAPTKWNLLETLNVMYSELAR